MGEEPDPRFTLANERTFLAWIRTCLALLAAGVAVEAFVPASTGAARRLLAGGFVVLATFLSAAVFVRWMNVERALRLGKALPVPRLAGLLTGGVAVLAVLALLLLILP